MQFKKLLVRIAHLGGKEILQAYLSQKNKLLPLKRSEQMGLQKVWRFTHRSTPILTVWRSKVMFLLIFV